MDDAELEDQLIRGFYHESPLDDLACYRDPGAEQRLVELAEIIEQAAREGWTDDGARALAQLSALTASDA